MNLLQNWLNKSTFEKNFEFSEKEATGISFVDCIIQYFSAKYVGTWQKSDTKKRSSYCLAIINTFNEIIKLLVLQLTVYLTGVRLTD